MGGEFEFWVLILEEGNGEFKVQGKEMLVCEQRIEIFTFFGSKEVSGFVMCIWWGEELDLFLNQI